MTDKSLLNKMQGMLLPFDVYIRDAKASVKEDFDAKEPHPKLTFQIRYGLTDNAETMELPEANEPSSKAFVLRYFADTGVRFTEEKEAEDDSEEPLVRAEITATWVVEYRVAKPEDIDAAGIEAFADNVMYHVWPYWREFIHASCARLRLPQVVLPMFRLKHRLGEARESEPVKQADTV